jgi:PAS domain S-box-containing protein
VPARARQVLVWTGIVLLALLIVAVCIPIGRGGATADLQGEWELVSVDGEPAVGTIRLPGLFGPQGIAEEAHVVVRRTVVIPEDDVFRSIWLENPQYAIRVWWDGEELGGVGDPGRDGREWRSDESALIPLPREPGEHDVRLEIRGDYAEGGLTGRMLLGTRRELRTISRQADADKLGLALMLALLGIVQLVIASRAPHRHAHLWFGVFATALAIWAFSQTDTVASVVPDLPTLIRIRRVSLPFVPAGGAAFLAAFVYSGPRRLEAALLVVGVALSVPGLLLPVDWLYTLEKAQDVFLVGCTLWACWIAFDGGRRRVPGIRLLLLSAFPPLLVGTIGSILTSHGLAGGATYLFPAFTLFVGGMATSLSLRYADEAERHERLLAGSSDAMVSVDATGTVTDVNPAARALLGASTGMTLFSWAAPEDHGLLRAHIERGISMADRAEFRVGREPDPKVLESIATPLDATTTLLVLRDVTKRRQIDQGMLHAARMETIGVLVGGIAHDFNNMLGALLAHVGVLQGTLAGTPHQARLDRMESTIERASQLTRRLLTVAGGTSADLAPVNLVTLVKNAIDLVEPTLPDDVSLRWDGPDDLPQVLGSPNDLEQVIVNLLVNARDAVGQRGRIQVWIRAFSLPSGARGVCVAVDDDGPGVPAGKREEIFEPFVTTKPPNKGTGLGLAVAAQILRDHHGRIWVEPRPGGGARFLFALRHADSADELTAPLPEHRDVLLAEDEEPLRDSYAQALQAAGYRVTACASGHEAARQLMVRRPAILVTDVVMPGLSGIEVAQQCNARYPDVPVLLVSGFIPDRTLAPLEDGTWARLDKPVRSARLVSTVGRLCRRAERAGRGAPEITDVRALFPSLLDLTGEMLGLPDQSRQAG